MVAESTYTPFCCERRASHATRVSKGAFSRRMPRLPAAPGSLPVMELASPDSRAERSMMTSSDSPLAEGGGALLVRGVEFGAAGLVLLFGVGLLLGYIAAERVTCF